MTNDSDPLPRLYTALAAWFPLLTAPEDYAEEAAYYQKLIVASSSRPVKEVLELGSGGGNNASHLKRHFNMTLVDRSPDMLAVSQALNPECEHLLGDMRTARLERQFDAIFIHDAVMYLTSLDDLRQAIDTAYLHCRPGGVALLAPDHTRESFRPSTDHGGNDGPDRALRYLEWAWDPDPTDDTFLVDFAYLLREPGGQLHCDYDRHVLGLFSCEDWLRLIGAAGFQARAVHFEHSEVEAGTVEVFLGQKPMDQKDL